MIRALCLLVLLFVSPSLAQAPQQTCPIAVKKVNPRAFPFSSGLLDYESGKDPWDSYLQIEYSNVSNKTIAGIRFGVYFVSGMREADRSVYNYESEQKVRPGETKKPYWADGVYEHEYGRTMGAMVWPQRIMYEDGTYWTDDGTQSCGNVKFIQPQASQPAQPQMSPAVQQAMAILNPAPALPATMGSIMTVFTDPAGADIAVDGKSTGGRIRFLLLNKAGAERTVLITMKGYKTVEKKLIPDGKPITLNLKLEKDTAN
jgi:hypothetical protein